MAWLVAGLGNPEPRYFLTRHNIGFMALDAFLASGSPGVGSAPSWKSGHRSLYLAGKIGEEPVIFAKPQTYMNRSGEAVAQLSSYYKLAPEQVLIVHDEVDLPFGTLRLQHNRGPGGHNGLKSINECLGGAGYVRLRVGVGRPPHPQQTVADFVLENFNAEEMSAMPELLERAGDAIELVCLRGWEIAANQINRGV